jgi:hypothetical protein
VLGALGVLSVFASVAIAVLWVSAPRVEGGRGQAEVVEGERPTVTDAAPPRLPTIAEENLKPGDVTWPAPNDPTVWDKVRGFTDRVSAQRGESVGLYVSTHAKTFTVMAVRMGWYGGTGGRPIWRSDPQPGVNQPAADVNAITGMRSAPWTKSMDVKLTDDFVPGIYILRLVSSDGGQSMVPLVVRDDTSHAAILVVAGVTTWQAYNGWGGANLYSGVPGDDARKRSEVVSFDRPYDGNGTGEYFGREDKFLMMAEQQGLDVTYTTDVDVHAHPDLLLNHKAYVAPTHDEYWTVEMRDAVERARDHGVNLLFMGANAAFRRIRLEPSNLGPFRQEVNYRVARQDPLYGKDNDQVTTSFREEPNPRPESSMIGNFYECNPVDADMVIVESSAWMFAGTGLKDGDKLPKLVGNEYDRVTPEVPTPLNIEVVAHSPVRCGGKRSFADMTYYTAASGAGVFATGTFRLETHLGEVCPDDKVIGVDCQIRKMTMNILKAFAAGPVGGTHPSTSNLAKLGIRAGYVR